MHVCAYIHKCICAWLIDSYAKEQVDVLLRTMCLNAAYVIRVAVGEHRYSRLSWTQESAPRSVILVDRWCKQFCWPLKINWVGQARWWGRSSTMMRILEDGEVLKGPLSKALPIFFFNAVAHFCDMNFVVNFSNLDIRSCCIGTVEDTPSRILTVMITV